MTHRPYKNVFLKGEITIFLSLLSAIFLGLVCAFSESVRVQMLRMNTESVMDASLRSCFAEYDQMLYKRYDLLYIDSSYRGHEETDIDSVINHLGRYAAENTAYDKTSVTGEWYGQSLSDADHVSYVIASDEGGRPFKRQAVEYMEKYGKAIFIGAVNSGKGSIKRGEKNDFFAKWDEILAKIDSYGIPLTNPGKIVREMVLSEDEFLKGTPLPGTVSGDRPSARSLKQGDGTAKIKRKNENDDLFIEYLMQKCGCYTEFAAMQQLKAELEYIVYGGISDRDNMISAVKELMDIRLKDNLRCIKGDGGKMAAAYEKAYEVVMYNCLIIPPESLILLVRDSIVYAWAYAESAVDVGRLLNNGRSPVIKSPSQVKLSLNDIMRFRSFLNDKGGQGISYKDYVGVFLEETDDRTKRMRCMDIIEGNQRCFHNGSFRIDGCVSYLEAGVEMSSGYGFSHETKRDCIYE